MPRTRAYRNRRVNSTSREISKIMRVPLKKLSIITLEHEPGHSVCYEEDEEEGAGPHRSCELHGFVNNFLNFLNNF